MEQVMPPLVTVVTPTTGAATVRKAIESVKQQTYPHIQHLIFVDGRSEGDAVCADYSGIDVISLPYPVGTDRFNGHRMYGASAYLSKGEFICFLDEDNWLEPNHVESLMQVMQTGVDWAYSLRRIMNTEGTFVCNDDCESLGKWVSCLGDHFVDVGCYFFPRALALELSPIWHRKAREPGVMEVDRMLMRVLHEKTRYNTSGEYTLNYRTGNTPISVQKEFFLQGNEFMKTKYEGIYPWRKAIA
jgi:glycosyltransferase involved in cell wall biosynthesis